MDRTPISRESASAFILGAGRPVNGNLEPRWFDVPNMVQIPEESYGDEDFNDLDSGDSSDSPIANRERMLEIMR